MTTKSIIIPDEILSSKIYLIREKKVMIDSDLSELYKVETKRLNEQVRRNISRFPEDFMFQLSIEEWNNLKSQNATTSWGGRRTPPLVFTEHGVLMLSSVLNSDRAIEVNIKIMRVYTKIKELLSSNKDLLHKMEEMEKKVNGQDEKIIQIFNYLKQFMSEKNMSRNKVGYK